jgi:argininosuccinate lyase
MAALWGGRFKKPFDEDAKRLSFSLHVDQRLFPFDIRVNQAHSKALGKAGYLTAQESEALVNTLQAVGEQLSQPNHGLFENDEDIHSCIERLVTAKLGDLGKKMHTGKSRNDQVITDVRLYIKEAITTLVGQLDMLRKTLCDMADAHIGVIFPGFTHFQTAQPVLLAHHLLVYVHQFGRDKQRFLDTLKRTDVCTLGSGALAGNNYGLDRDFLAKELGFAAVSANSMDAVSDRDFLVEFLSNASLCMTHLSRFCEELVLWSSPLINFVEIGDDFTTGSSLMPQKKNPDVAELIRGKTGRVLGDAVGLIHILKATPLTYNRDFQEDKEMVFDAMDTLSLSLLCFEKMLHTLRFNEKNIAAALEKGYLLATDLADYLVFKGVPFRESHEITGKIVAYAADKQKQFSELSLDELKTFSDRIHDDVYDVFDMKKAVDMKTVHGGTATEQVRIQLNTVRKELGC